MLTKTDFSKVIQANPMIYLIHFMCYGSEKVTFIVILKLPPSYKSTKILTRKQHSYISFYTILFENIGKFHPQNTEYNKK